MPSPDLRAVSISLLFGLLVGGWGGGAVAESGATAEPDVAAKASPEESALGEAKRPESLEKPDIEAVGARQTREASLIDVLAARRDLVADLRERQEELGSEAARGREADIEEQIRVLSREVEELDRSFAELASGLDPSSLTADAEAKQLELTSELRDLLSPLVNELKRATSRPREIDRLRTEIAQTEDQLLQIANARERISTLRSNVSDPLVIEALEGEEESWGRNANALRTSLKIAQQKLDQRLSESQTLAETIENVFQLFFKSRGRNLLVALLVTLVFLYGLRRIRVFLARRPALNRHSASFQGRIFGLIYTAFTALGAVLVFLLALYFFGDWVLLILMLLLLLGVVWTSKQAIPRFWGQTVLLLDMGPVREGERLFLNGLPWRVDSISFYSELTNPELTGGEIRLPIDDLSSMRSRAYQEDEPWFPTRVGDVILLPDGPPARVEFQSIEIVRLRKPGENQIAIPTLDFIAQPIERLSSGYRVNISFGLDYADQANITTTMKDLLGREIESRWRRSPWADSMVSSAVEFENAGASSLDLFVRVDLDGSCAFDLEAQKRALATHCVDVCNEQGWTIPFSQLTLHVAGNEIVEPPSDG